MAKITNTTGNKFGKILLINLASIITYIGCSKEIEHNVKSKNESTIHKDIKDFLRDTTSPRVIQRELSASVDDINEDEFVHIPTNLSIETEEEKNNDNLDVNTDLTITKKNIERTPEKPLSPINILGNWIRLSDYYLFKSPPSPSKDDKKKNLSNSEDKSSNENEINSNVLSSPPPQDLILKEEIKTNSKLKKSDLTPNDLEDKVEDSPVVIIDPNDVEEIPQEKKKTWVKRTQQTLLSKTGLISIKKTDSSEKPKGNIWKEKQYLISLDIIKNCKINHRTLLDQAIKKNSEKNLEIIFDDIIDYSDIERNEIEQKFKRDGYPSIRTFLQLLIKNKPKSISPEKKEDKIDLFKGTPEDFNFRIIVIDLNSTKKIDGVIEEYHRNNNEVRLILANNSKTSTRLKVINKKTNYVVEEELSKDINLINLINVNLSDKSLKKIKIQNELGDESIFEGNTFYFENLSEEICKSVPPKKTNFINKFFSAFNTKEKNNDKDHLVKIITLRAKKSNKKYNIKYYENSNKKLLRIEIQSDNFIENYEKAIFAGLEAKYRVKLISLSSKYIKPSMVSISDKKDEELENKIYTNKVRELKYDLCRKILQIPNLIPTLMRKMINNQINYDKIVISDSFINETFKKTTQEIHKLYQKLGANLSVNDISEDILINSYIISMTQTSDGQNDNLFKVERVLRILEESFKHISKIENQDVYLLLGNTKAGKSTLTNFLIGEKLKYKKTKLGDNIVVKANENGQKEFNTPKIGNKLTISETIFAEAYQAMKNQGSHYSTLILDCPGFGDSRGEELEICTNLSVDLALQKSKNIKGIGVVIPLDHMLTRELNPKLLNLFDSLKERFPWILSIDEVAQLPIKIFFTKNHNVNIDRIISLTSGNFTNEQLSELVQMKDFKYNVINFIHYMITNNKFHIVNITKDSARVELMDEISNSHLQIDKSTCKSILNTGNLNSLNKLINSAIYTWNKLFTHKLQEIPDQRRRIESKIIDLENIISNKKSSMEAREKNIEENKHLSSSLKELLDSLNSKKELGDKMKDLQEEAEKLINKNYEKDKQQLENRIKEIQENMKRLDNENSSKKLTIKEIEDKVQKAENKHKKISQQLEKLILNPKKDVLWEYKQKKITDEFTICSFNQDDRLKSYEKGDFEYESTNSRTVKVKDMSGILYHDAIISSKYTLQYKEGLDDDQDIVDKYGALQESEFVADVTGKQYEPDLKPKFVNDGKKVLYGFKTFWDDHNRLPFIKIEHTIPGRICNAVEINDIKSEMKCIEKTNINYNREISEYKGSIKAHNDEMRRLVEQYRLKKSELKKIKDSIEKETQQNLIEIVTQKIKKNQDDNEKEQKEIYAYSLQLKEYLTEINNLNIEKEKILKRGMILDYVISKKKNFPYLLNKIFKNLSIFDSSDDIKSKEFLQNYKKIFGEDKL